MPAISPTLSPTLSAITPGFLGSSSGMPASIFPTKSAPTSALLVKIPPPTLENRATADAPTPNPSNDFAILSGSSIAPLKYTYRPPRPTKPIEATHRPIIDPPKNEIDRACS